MARSIEQYLADTGKSPVEHVTFADLIALKHQRPQDTDAAGAAPTAPRPAAKKTSGRKRS